MNLFCICLQKGQNKEWKPNQKDQNTHKMAKGTRMIGQTSRLEEVRNWLLFCKFWIHTLLKYKIYKITHPLVTIKVKFTQKTRFLKKIFRLIIQGNTGFILLWITVFMLPYNGR